MKNLNLFQTYLEQVNSKRLEGKDVDPDELELKKLAMEIIKLQPSSVYNSTFDEKTKEFIKFLFYKLAIKSIKLNTIQLWDNFLKYLKNTKLKKENIYEPTVEQAMQIFLKNNKTPESEIKRAQRIFDDKFIEDNKIPFFTKLAEEKTNNKQLIKKVIRDIWG